MSHVIRAIAFDAYGTLFDVHSVGALAQDMFPGHGAELSRLWRTKQIEYTQLRTLAGRYEPFDRVTRDALVFALRALGLSAGAPAIERLMAQYQRLAPFAENLAALRELRALALPLAILSNGTPGMIAEVVANAGMDGLFDHLLSVDAVGKYKTHPDAYRLGPQAFGLPAAQILFVSSNCWDVVGSSWFGYPAFWINRGGQPLEELGVEPAARGTQLSEVVQFARRHCPS